MRFALRSLLGLAALATLATTACNKDDDDGGTTPTGPRRWTKVYRDVIIGDDSNTVEGHYLDTRTGIVHKMQTLPDSLRDNVSLMFYVTQTGSYDFVTTPGSIYDLPTSNSEHSSLIWSHPVYGLDRWSAAQKNTFEARLAAYGEELTPQEFESVAASGSWESFNTAFKASNNGGDYLGFVQGNFGPGGGEVYLGEINNALRCMIYVKSASSGPTNGFVKFDMIVEGRTDALSGAAAVMPAE